MQQPSTNNCHPARLAVTSHKGITMNKHQLTYVQMYPEPVTSAEPSGFVIWAGAAFALGALYLTTVFLFSL